MSYLANWQSYTSLARLLNGLALLVVALVAQFSPELSGPGYLVLGLLLAYFVISAAPQLRTRVQANALFLIVDLLLVTFVAYTAGGLSGPVPILYVLPVMAAAWLFADLTALLFTALALLGLIALCGLSGWQNWSSLASYMVAIVGATALAYQPARELGRRQLELSGLQELMVAIVSIPSLEDTLRELVMTIGLMLGSDQCVFLEYDSGDGKLKALEPVLGLTEEEVQRFQVAEADTPLMQAFHEGEVRSWRRGEAASGNFRQLMESLEARELLCAPLEFENTAFGVVALLNREARAFDHSQTQLLRVLATQAGVILEIGRLHRLVAGERSKLSAALQSLSGGVLMTDPAGQITMLNPLAAAWLDVQPQQAMGASFRELANRAFVGLLEESLGTTDTVAGEIELKAGEAENFVQVRVDSMVDPEGRVLGKVAVMNDVTELRRIERMKTDFVSTVSHELRTPLTSIKAFARTLLREDVEWPRPKQVEFLQIIDTQCDRLTRLISDLLDISRIESGRALRLRWDEIDLAAILASVVEEQRSYSGNHKLTLELPEQLPKVAADRDKVAQIATNLVSNAIKYSPAGGQITIKVVEEPDRLVVSVQDEGIGIPEDKLPSLFSRFYQVDSSSTRKIGGTGIGLFLVKHLTEAHGGQVWVESAPEAGSTFYFSLPKLTVAEREAQVSEG